MVTQLSTSVEILTSEYGDIPLKHPTELLQNTEKKDENLLSRISDNARTRLDDFLVKHKRKINMAVALLLNFGFVVYFAFATYHFIEQGLDKVPFCDGDEYGLLILLVCFVYLLLLYTYVFKPHTLPVLSSCLGPLLNFLRLCFSSRLVRWVVCLFFLVAIVTFLVIDTLDDPNRLIALAGFVLMLLFGFVFSKHPGQIKWRPVILGLFVQFVLGLFTIRWEFGRNIFKCAGDKVSTFLKYTDVGSSFVYGDYLVSKNVFAFEALSVIFFLCFVVKILYYYGIIQKVVLSLGWFLSVAMGTTICESVNSAANIFLGMTEAPILLQPYLQQLTVSETHAVMTAGFASVSGTVLAAYITFGAKPSHLITASVMSAPAALCFSKLFYPEIEESQSKLGSIVIPESEDSSVLDAASKGATQGVQVVLGIVANVIAFVTFIAFLNGIINWFGILIGQENWSIEEGLSYVFMPLSFVMGVPWQECKYVGRLIGIKTAINEFSAYKELGELIKLKLLSKRSEAIATYAVCGFSNPGSVGIMLSTMATLMPEKREIITSLAFRSFVAGAITCFMTACIAGMLMSEEQL